MFSAPHDCIWQCQGPLDQIVWCFEIENNPLLPTRQINFNHSKSVPASAGLIRAVLACPLLFHFIYGVFQAMLASVRQTDLFKQILYRGEKSSHWRNVQQHTSSHQRYTLSISYHHLTRKVMKYLWEKRVISLLWTIRLVLLACNTKCFYRCKCFSFNKHNAINSDKW